MSKAFGNAVSRSKRVSQRRGSLKSTGSSLGASVYASTIVSMDTDDSDEDAEPLNDQQWVLQRKKIGLSRKTKRSLARVNQSESKKNSIVAFLQSFKRKECVRYVPFTKNMTGRPLGARPGPQGGYPCHCGSPEDEHKSRAALKLEANRHLVSETILEEDEESRASSASSSGLLSVGSGVPILDVLTRPWTSKSRKSTKEPQKVEPLWTISPNENLNPRNRGLSNDEDKETKPAVPDVTVAKASTASTATSSMETPHTVEWSDEADVHEFPTNAFGVIDFLNEDEGSEKPSKYVRVSDNTPMTKIKTLLIDYWGIFRPHRPHLALSLIGGAKNFRMEGRKKEIFKTGLVKAAKSTNALILTGGNNIGAMKLVGDAVREGQFFVQDGNKMSRGIKLLGLSNWGYVKNNWELVNAVPNELHTCSYVSNIEMKKGDNTPLNGDHTHFLLIDDGSRYRFFGKYSEFITRFETMVRDEGPDGLGIPIVTLLLEGGKDAIRIIKERLAEGISAVIIEGSGRAADIIAYAYRNAMKNNITGTYTLKEGHIDHLMRMLETNFGFYWINATPEVRTEHLKQIMNWTLECIRYSDILTIFDIRRETQLDKKILSALLKGHDMSLHHQLYLAMVWNRVDLAEEKIFVHGHDTLKMTDNLDSIMIEALLMERSQFIEILVMNGFVMKNFLTVERLALLYNESGRKFKELHVQLKEICDISSREIYLRHIHKFLVHVLKDHNQNYYQAHTTKTAEKTELTNKTFEEPYLELFFWAILTGKLALIDFFWARVNAPLLAAILAGSIYSKLFNFYKSRTTSLKVLKKQKDVFQDRANKLVEIAFRADWNKGVSLMERRNKRWGERNLMEIAYIGHLRAFIANPSCQAVTQAAWRRGFTRLSRTACLIGTFLPFLVWTPLVKFQPGLGDEGGHLNPFQKLYVFYRCPIVKYTGTCFSFISFLFLHSYVVLYGFRWHYQLPEIALHCWILVLILDEVREVFTEPSKNLKGKMADYFFSVWNQFDTILSIFATLAFIMRNFEYTFWYARVILALNCAFYYVRVFRIYHASRSLGPKLVIFHRMIPEIVTFLFLLIIFIMAYGVASQAIIDPYRLFQWDTVGQVFFNIFFLPYWQMYGELSLDEIKVKDTITERCEHLWSGNETTIMDDCVAPDVNHINDFNYVTPIFLSIYLLIGNVMLLNLLIAIFTSVFEEVHENSNEVWKWEMYRLVAEYDQRPGLAPPLVILEDIFKLLKAIWKRTCRRKKENLDNYMVETMNMLKLFEKDSMAQYLTERKQQEEETLEHKIKLLDTKTDHLMDMFEDAPDDQANWGAAISTEEKLYKTHGSAKSARPKNSSSSSSSSDETDDNTKLKTPSKSKTVRFSAKSKSKDGQNQQGFKGQNVPRPGTVRAQTARAKKKEHDIQKELEDVKDQLARSEERRKEDIIMLEHKIDSNQKKLENLLKAFVATQDRSRRKESESK